MTPDATPIVTKAQDITQEKAFKNFGSSINLEELDKQVSVEDLRKCFEEQVTQNIEELEH